MNPKLCKRFAFSSPGGRSIPIVSETEIKKTSIQSDASLLLSIADICKSEIKTGGLVNLWRDDLTLPNFPCLSDATTDAKALTPRTESLRDFMSTAGNDIYPSNRVRSVSIDSPRLDTVDERKVESPVSFSGAPTVSPLHTPVSNRRLPFRKQSLRLSSKARREHVHPELSIPSSPRSGKALQGPCAKGVQIKKILRKKFSWKNYPEVRD